MYTYIYINAYIYIYICACVYIPVYIWNIYTHTHICICGIYVYIFSRLRRLWRLIAWWHHGRLRRLSGVMPTDAFISCRDAVMVRGSSLIKYIKAGGPGSHLYFNGRLWEAMGGTGGSPPKLFIFYFYLYRRLRRLRRLIAWWHHGRLRRLMEWWRDGTTADLFTTDITALNLLSLPWCHHAINLLNLLNLLNIYIHISSLYIVIYIAINYIEYLRRYSHTYEVITYNE